MSFFNFHSLVSNRQLFGCLHIDTKLLHPTKAQNRNHLVVLLLPAGSFRKVKIRGNLFLFVLYQPNAKHWPKCIFNQSKSNVHRFWVFSHKGSQHVLHSTWPGEGIDCYMLPLWHMMSLSTSFDMLLSVQAPWPTSRTGPPMGLPPVNRRPVFFSSGVAEMLPLHLKHKPSTF